MTVLFHRERVLAVGFVERARPSVNGNHGELILRPFLNLTVAQLNGHLARAFHRHRAVKFLSIDVDGEFRREAFEALRPAGGILEGEAERFACFRVIGNGRLIGGVCLHDESPSYERGQISAQLYLWRWSRLNGKKPGGPSRQAAFQIAPDSDIVRQFFSCRPLRERRIVQRDLAKGLAWNDGPHLTPKKKR